MDGTVPQELILDIRYAKTANGIVLLPAAQRPEWWIECDSSLKGGRGVFSNTHYYSTGYRDTLTEKELDISQLEAITP